MDNMVKKICVAIIIIMLFSSTSCIGESFEMQEEIKDTAGKVMEYIANEDADSLFNMFSPYIKENRKDETMNEIEKAFEYIDGEIVSYEYRGEGGGGKSKRDGKIVLYRCYPEFGEVITDTGTEYIVSITHYHIWDEKPEWEGVGKIVIYEEDDVECGIVIGQNYIEIE